MSATLHDPAVLIMVLGLAALGAVGVALRRRPGVLLLLALLTLAVSVRYLDAPASVDRATFTKAMTALDNVLKTGTTAAALWYARCNGVDRRRLLPVAALAVMALLSFGPADFHPELTPLQVLRSFIALSTTWILLAARRTPQDAERQVSVLMALPILDLVAGLLLWSVGLNEMVRHEYTGAWRLQGASIPAHLGILSAVGVGAAVHAWSLGRRGAGLLAALNLAIVVLTGTRTAIALSLVFIVAGLAGRAKLLRLRPRRFLTMAMAYAVLLGVVGYAYFPALRDRFVGNPMEAVVNTSGRTQAWDFYWGVAQVEPLFGRGLGAATVANTGQLPSAFTVPHNEYLRLLVEGGWVGLTLYLGTAAIAVAPLVRRTGTAGSRAGVAIGVWAAYCVVDNALSTPQGSVTFATLIAAIAAGAGSPRAGEPVWPAKPVVVYIAGVSRSGSTLLERAFDRVPGVCGVGELVHLWRRGAVGNELCSCGTPFRSCPFWMAVGRRLVGGWEADRVYEVVRLQQRTGRHRRVPAMMLRLESGRRRRESQAYCRSMAELYSAVAAESAARVVVDSSKLPAGAHLLARSGLVDLRVVHLVRDSRAYAYAAQKTIPRPEAPGECMPRPGVVRCSLEWLGFHLLAAALRGCSSRYARLSYEEFARDPGRALDRVMWVFDRTDHDGVVELAGATATLDLRPWHAVSGNPLRFVEGRVPVRPDDQWRRGLPARSRWLVTVLTTPGLLHYGYLRRSGPGSGRWDAGTEAGPGQVEAREPSASSRG
jgi:O-antigen ligase